MDVKEYIINEKYKIIGTDLNSAIKTYLNFYGYNKIESVRVNGQVIKPRPGTMITFKGLLNYRGYTCFMDSLIVPMLLVDGYFGDKLLRGGNECQNKVSKVLLELKDSMMNNEERTCKNLIGILRSECNFNDELLTGQNDDSEFLIALMDVYNLLPTKTKLTRMVSNDSVNWKITSANIVPQSLLEITISKNENILDIYQSVNYEDFGSDVESYPTDSNERKYRYLAEKDNIVESECLIFHCRRLLGSVKTTDSIKFEPYIVSGKKVFELKIVTIHQGNAIGGHYTSLFKWNNDWVKYDDLEGDLEIINLEYVLKVGSTNASLLIYY